MGYLHFSGSRGWGGHLRDLEFMKEQFRKCVMETVYPLYQTTTLPAYTSGDAPNEQARREAVLLFKRQKVERRDILAMLLSTEVAFKPMDLKEMTFNVIGPYCKAQNLHQVEAS